MRIQMKRTGQDNNINPFPVCNGQSRVIVNIFAELVRGGRGLLEVKDIKFFCCQANLSG